MRSLEKGLGLTWITTALVIAAVPSAWAEVNKFGELARLDGLAAPFALVLLGLMSISSFRGLRSGVVVGLHMAAIVGITLIVGRAQPDLWVHPFGFLVLNLNAAAATWAAWRIRIGAGGRRTSQVLLWALSILWFTQGLLPKILYQHPLDLELVGAVLGDLMDPGRFLWLLGAFEMAIAVLTLALRGTRLRALLLIQAILLAGFAVPVRDPSARPAPQPLRPDSKDPPRSGDSRGCPVSGTKNVNFNLNFAVSGSSPRPSVLMRHRSRRNSRRNKTHGFDVRYPLWGH